MTRILGKDDLLGNNLKRELVPVPELGGSIWLRDIGAEGVLNFNARIKQFKESGDSEVTPEISFELMALAVSLSACDESGELLYSEGDIQALVKNNNISVLSRLGGAALKLSGLDVGIADKLSSEVADNLPNAHMNSSSGTSRASSRKRARKS